YEVGQSGGRSYISMELVEGKTIASLLAGGPLLPALAIKIAAQVARGLEKAHARGLVHRDIKPGNIMLNSDGYAKLLDFGIAKRLMPAASDEAPTTPVAATAAGLIVGTLGYFSPEQIRQQSVDPRSDIFSLGVLLYEMATGKAPFHRDTFLDTL